MFIIYNKSPCSLSTHYFQNILRSPFPFSIFPFTVLFSSLTYHATTTITPPNVPHDNTQDGTIDAEESEAGEPETGDEGAAAKELEVESLVEPEGLGEDPGEEDGGS